MVFNWWEKMICKWQSSFDQQNFKLCFSNKYTNWKECPHPSRSACEWNSENHIIDTIFNLIFILADRTCTDITNCTGQMSDVTSKAKVDTDEIIHIEPAKNITVSATQREISLSWSYLDKERHWGDYLYKVNITSQWEPNRVTSMLLCNSSLHYSNATPHTEYNVSIEGLPIPKLHIQGAKRVAQGYWSKPVCKMITTAQDVPAAAPQLTDGGFLVQDMSGTQRKVTVYTKSIPRNLQNGEIITSRMCYSPISMTASCPQHIQRENQTCTYCSHNSTNKCLQMEIIFDNNKAFLLTVDARTEHGYNNNLSLQSVTILSQEQLVAMKEELTTMVVVANSSGSVVYISWDPIVSYFVHVIILITVLMWLKLLLFLIPPD
jgi:hypothetical protein